MARLRFEPTPAERARQRALLWDEQADDWEDRAADAYAAGDFETEEACRAVAQAVREAARKLRARAA